MRVMHYGAAGSRPAFATSEWACWRGVFPHQRTRPRRLGRRAPPSDQWPRGVANPSSRKRSRRSPTCGTLGEDTLSVGNANDRRADRPTGIRRPCLFSSAALGPGLRSGFKNAIRLPGGFSPRTHASEILAVPVSRRSPSQGSCEQQMNTANNKW